MSNALTADEARYFIQFIHPAKILGMFPAVSGATVAAQMGIPEAQYAAVLAEFDHAVDHAARTLMAEDQFAAQVAALPFAPGEKVVALGDSITDDLGSWFEILRVAYALAHPGTGVRFVNAGISGDTTSTLISRFYAVTLERPAWILFMAGTNDTRTHGLEPARSVVSLQETVANYQILCDFAARQTAARWVWMTPPPVIEAAITQDWWLGPQQMMWTNARINAIVAHLRARRELLIDVNAAFGAAPDPALYRSDGLHPALAGQTLIARTVVHGLSVAA